MDTKGTKNAQIPSKFHGSIDDKAKAMWAACTCGIADYLFSEFVISLLWEKEFIEVGNSYNTDEGRHFIYTATEKGRTAFSRNQY